MVRHYLKPYNKACLEYYCNVKHYRKRYRNACFERYCNAFNMRENMCENILSRVNSRY